MMKETIRPQMYHLALSNDVREPSGLVHMAPYGQLLVPVTKNSHMIPDSCHNNGPFYA